MKSLLALEFAFLCFLKSSVGNPLDNPFVKTIGTGMSQAIATSKETVFFEHQVDTDDDTTEAVMTHFWCAGSTWEAENPMATADNLIIRYYIDGETQASVVFTPSTAAGVGFGEQEVRIPSA